jgi:chromate reductase, NAD(P)H dehydrogenase (quinone)
MQGIWERLMTSAKVAVLVGSARKDSLNKRLAKAFERLAPEALDFVWIKIDDLPFYNQDLELDRPYEVKRFTSEVRACDAVLAVMPEYNRSIPALLKNAIDWGSKPLAENVWRNKPTAIAGTSPGPFATAVGQQHLRQVLGVMGATVMGGECYIKYQRDDFISSEGIVADEATVIFLKEYIARFADLARRLTT